MDEMENKDFDVSEELDLDEDLENENLDDFEDDLEEETAAAGTLKPGAVPGETKAEMLATFTQLLAQLGKEDLSKFFNDSQAVFGPNKAPGAEDKAAANRASVDMKPSAAVGKGAWKEDVDHMFGEDLSEEFKEKAETVFEAAVNTRLNIEAVRLEEEFNEAFVSLQEEMQQELEEQIAAITESVVDKLDAYINYCVEQFMEENALAIENGLRLEIAENFIQGLHNLFAENFIAVPEEKLDLVAEMKAELEETRAQLNEVLDEKIQLEGLVVESTKDSIIDELSEGLALTQAEKLRALTEDLEFTDTETFRKKVNIVKENYFTDKKVTAPTGLITESIDGEDGNEDKPRYVAPGMERYVEAIKKTAK